MLCPQISSHWQFGLFSDYATIGWQREEVTDFILTVQRAEFKLNRNFLCTINIFIGENSCSPAHVFWLLVIWPFDYTEYIHNFTKELLITKEGWSKIVLSEHSLPFFKPNSIFKQLIFVSFLLSQSTKGSKLSLVFCHEFNR